MSIQLGSPPVRVFPNTPPGTISTGRVILQLDDGSRVVLTMETAQRFPTIWNVIKDIGPDQDIVIPISIPNVHVGAIVKFFTDWNALVTNGKPTQPTTIADFFDYVNIVNYLADENLLNTIVDRLIKNGCIDYSPDQQKWLRARYRSLPAELQIKIQNNANIASPYIMTASTSINLQFTGQIGMSNILVRNNGDSMFTIIEPNSIEVKVWDGNAIRTIAKITQPLVDKVYIGYGIQHNNIMIIASLDPYYSNSDVIFFVNFNGNVLNKIDMVMFSNDEHTQIKSGEGRHFKIKSRATHNPRMVISNFSGSIHEDEDIVVETDPDNFNNFNVLLNRRISGIDYEHVAIESDHGSYALLYVTREVDTERGPQTREYVILYNIDARTSLMEVRVTSVSDMGDFKIDPYRKVLDYNLDTFEGGATIQSYRAYRFDGTILKDDIEPPCKYQPGVLIKLYPNNKTLITTDSCVDMFTLNSKTSDMTLSQTIATAGVGNVLPGDLKAVPLGNSSEVSASLDGRELVFMVGHRPLLYSIFIHNIYKFSASDQKIYENFLSIEEI